MGTERSSPHRPPTLDWTLESRSDPTLILRGEIDASTADQLEAALAALSRESGGRLFVDLGGVTFIDSTAVHSFMEAHQSTREEDRRLVFGGSLQPTVEKVFDVMGLADILEVELE